MGNDFPNERPDMAVIFRAFSLPGVAERLARVSSGNKVNCRETGGLKKPDVSPAGDARPVFFKDSVAVFINFNLSFASHSGPFKAKREAPDPGAQVEERHCATCAEKFPFNTGQPHHTAMPLGRRCGKMASASSAG